MQSDMSGSKLKIVNYSAVLHLTVERNTKTKYEVKRSMPSLSSYIDTHAVPRMPTPTVCPFFKEVNQIGMLENRVHVQRCISPPPAPLLPPHKHPFPTPEITPGSLLEAIQTKILQGPAVAISSSNHSSQCSPESILAGDLQLNWQC